MTLSPSSRSPSASGGFILIAVLWILAALATLAAIYSVYAINTAAASHVADDRAQSEASVRAGVELAAMQLLAAPERQRPSRGAFAVRLGRTKIAVRFRTERARIDLNLAPKEMLVRLFAAVGVDESAASDYADHIVGWRTAPTRDADSKEAAAYKTAGLAYPPRQAPFNDPLELGLVRGLPAEVVTRILPDLTVFNGTAQIDVVEAGPEALAALPGATPEILHKLLSARAADPQDGQGMMKLLGVAASGASTEAGNTFRAEVEVDLGRGSRVRADVVFELRDGDATPYDLLAWRDDFDGALP